VIEEESMGVLSWDVQRHTLRVHILKRTLEFTPVKSHTYAIGRRVTNVLQDLMNCRATSEHIQEKRSSFVVYAIDDL